jgi:hypothetical protein
MTVATEEEAAQLGRNLAEKCEASFVALIAAQTSDPRFVAAAERGRREALAMTAVDGVHIVVSTDQSVIARVRDDAGIHDVTYGSVSGWSCSCGEPGHCSHVLAAQQTTEATAV